MRSFRHASSIAILLSLATPASALDVTKVEFAGETDAAPKLTGYLMRPPTGGRVPLVVALHGCSGLFTRRGELDARSRDWAERWNAAGYAVLFPDSFGSRGLGSQCRVAARSIRPADRARDARAAAAWGRAQGFVDPAQIALVGWSNGGSTVLWTVRGDFKPPAAEFATAIAFYPGCRPLAERANWRSRLPLTILIGAADDWTPAEPCRTLADGRTTRLVTYPGAYHDFDAPDRPVRELDGLAFTANKTGRAHAGTDPAARALAIDAVTRLLADAFARR